MMSFLQYLVPWEPSAALVTVFVLVAALYLRGSLRSRVSLSRRVTFWSGLALLYLSLHTKLDYYAEHEFFVHRIQHLILHHLGPLIIIASYPGNVLRAGLPFRWRMGLVRLMRAEPMRAVAAMWRILTAPWIVMIVFIASVLFWVIPSVQFVAMLDWRIYFAMNWSVTVSGLIYWQQVLDRRPAPPARMRPGMRVLSPIITMTPQILVGAIITFSQQDLYPIFDLCGRAFGLPILIDQSIGGLIIWIPAALIEALGAMMALRIWMQLSERGRLPAKPRRAAAISKRHSDPVPRSPAP